MSDARRSAATGRNRILGKTKVAGLKGCTIGTLLQRRFFRAFSKPWRKDSVV